MKIYLIYQIKEFDVKLKYLYTKRKNEIQLFCTNPRNYGYTESVLLNTDTNIFTETTYILQNIPSEKQTGPQMSLVLICQYVHCILMLLQ